MRLEYKKKVKQKTSIMKIAKYLITDKNKPQFGQRKNLNMDYIQNETFRHATWLTYKHFIQQKFCRKVKRSTLIVGTFTFIENISLQTAYLVN